MGKFLLGLIIGLVVGVLAIAYNPNLPEEVRTTLANLTGLVMRGTEEAAEGVGRAADDVADEAREATGGETGEAVEPAGARAHDRRRRSARRGDGTGRPAATHRVVPGGRNSFTWHHSASSRGCASGRGDRGSASGLLRPSGLRPRADGCAPRNDGAKRGIQASCQPTAAPDVRRRAGSRGAYQRRISRSPRTS
jgi:hypothetical protein